jgi:hypothetical protein
LIGRRPNVLESARRLPELRSLLVGAAVILGASFETTSATGNPLTVVAGDKSSESRQRSLVRRCNILARIRVVELFSPTVVCVFVPLPGKDMRAPKW